MYADVFYLSLLFYIMASVRQHKLKITEKSHWINYHPEAGYKKHARLLDNDIVHTWIDTEKDVVLDFLDIELLQTVLSEAGLIDKQFHIIFDLNHVTDISYRYKLGITKLLFHWEPYLGSICFYNICPSMLTVVRSFAYIAPEKICVLQSFSYKDALQNIMSFKAGDNFADKSSIVNTLDSSDPKKQFLSAVTKISWLNMLDVQIPLPVPTSIYFDFFQALETLRLDLMAKDFEKENEIKLLKQDCENRITQMNIKMNAQSEVSKKTLQDLKKEVAELKTTVATQDMELTRISTAIAEKTGKLRKLLDQITALDIEPSLKYSMTNSCLSLIETQTIEKRLDVELTESDSVFLSKLQKKHPNLNQREMRIALFVKLNHDTKDIATSLGISTRGMESIRYRMHKKLGLGKHQSIKTYLSDVVMGM